jgi:hypothetical protein
VWALVWLASRRKDLKLITHCFKISSLNKYVSTITFTKQSLNYSIAFETLDSKLFHLVFVNKTKLMKDAIPRALREQVWLTHVGKTFESKCMIPWCKNRMSAFEFHCGHNVPESKGGVTEIINLVPICSRCNLSMKDNYTIDEWSKLSKPVSKWKLFWRRWFCFNKCESSDTKENGTKSSPNPMNQNAKHSKFRGILSANKILPKKKRTARGTNVNKKT